MEPTLLYAYSFTKMLALNISRFIANFQLIFILIHFIFVIIVYINKN